MEQKLLIKDCPVFSTRSIFGNLNLKSNMIIFVDGGTAYSIDKLFVNGGTATSIDTKVYDSGSSSL